MRELIVATALACLFIGAIVLGVGVAHGEEITCHPQWSPRGKAVAKLAKNYQEAPVAIGLANDGSLIELIRTKDGATWSIINTLPNGCSRFIASGEAWEVLPPIVTGSES